MLRWSGVFAAALSALLVVLLARRTEVTELSGTVDHRPLLFQRPNDSLPGRPFVYITNRGPAGQIQQELERYSWAGIASTVIPSAQEGSSVLRTWRVDVPDAVAASMEVDDEAIVAVRKLVLPGDDDFRIRLVRYRFRRGTTIWSAGESDNWRFFAAHGLAGGGPILLWAIGSSIALLCGSKRGHSA